MTFIHTIARHASAFADAALLTAQRHPRRISAAIAALLLGSGATAFAVAQLVPDASQIQVSQVIEEVRPLPAGTANASSATQSLLADIPFTLYRTDTTRSNDTAESLLRRLGMVDASAAAFVRQNPAVRAALLGRAGRAVSAEADQYNRLLSLQVRWAPDDTDQFQRFIVEKSAGGFVSRQEAAPLVASTRLASGTIRSSLFAATDDAGIPDAVATQIAEIFAGDIDFHRALRKGDRFSIVYETLMADNEPMRTGRVLTAEFVNNRKTYQAAWFQEPGAAKGQYYTLEGNSLRKAFLTSPLEFSRITSGFGVRVHPISRDKRAHNGVDYGAPTGTPIRTVGDGVVSFAGVQRGYGNVVEVAHRDGKSTLYAHMHTIGVRKGQSVSQGDRIGTVGSTGWSTGPHLHFELRINGEYHDPLTIAQQSNSVPLSAVARPAFDRMMATLRPQLAAAALVTQASAQ